MAFPPPSSLPMTCDEVAARAFAWSEGELADEEHLRFDQHLDDCQGCAEFARTYAAVEQLVRTALEREVSPALQAELDASVFAALVGVA